MRKILFLFLFIPFLCLGETLTLKKSISIALKNNPSVKIAEEKLKEAEAEKGKALSNFFPKLSTSSSYTQLDKKKKMEMSMPHIPGMPPMPQSSITLTDNKIYDYNLSLTQPLFTGGKLTSLYRMRKENFEALKNYFKKTKNDLIFNVKKAYFNVLEAEKLEKVAEESLESLKSHLKVVEDFYKEGMVPQVDVLRAKVALANARNNLINAQNGVKLTKSYFNSVLNRKMDEEVNLEDILILQEGNFELSKCINNAFKNRPEIREMRNRLKMAEEGIKIARSNFFPQVFLIGNWDKKKGAEIPIDEWKESWSAVISVNMDIWDWGENRNEVKKAKAEFQQIKNDFSLLKNSIEFEVRKSYLNLLSAEEKIKVQEESVKEAEKNFKDTSLRFKEGMATNTDVLDSEVLLMKAKTDYYESLYDFQVAKAGLEKAIGKMEVK